MTRISIELVPRSSEHLREECAAVSAAFPSLDTLNIPDIMRMPIRSWEACRFTSDYFSNNIPHLRAIDFNIGSDDSILEAIEGFGEVLVVSGDPPHDFSRKVYPTSVTEVLEFLKTRRPDLKIYAAIDPYRSGIQQELEYAKQKIDSGADGFFTQPFFSIEFMSVFADLFHDTNVFWGVSPVVGERSRSYWETTNHVVFPSGYDFSLEGNKEFGRKALAFARQTDSNIYFMPIRMNAVDYLKDVVTAQ